MYITSGGALPEECRTRTRRSILISSMLRRMPSLHWRLNSLRGDLPPEFWMLWIGTIINRLGGFVIPFLTLFLTSQRGIPVN